MQASHDPQHQVEKNVRRRIESSIAQHPGVKNHPRNQQRGAGADELPTASKFRDQIRHSRGECLLRIFLFVDIARDSPAQEFIGAAQSVTDRTDHLHRHIGIAANEAEKVLSRQHRNPRILNRGGICGPRFAVDEGDLTKEVSFRQFGKDDPLIKLVSHANAHATGRYEAE